MKEIKDQALRQELDENGQSQLITAIAQASGVDADSIRVYMGRRIVYGELASGEVRRELEGDRASSLIDALAVEQTIASATQYQGKVPAIEIRAGDEILFRQERDGAVTANLLLEELEERDASPEESECDDDEPVCEEFFIVINEYPYELTCYEAIGPFQSSSEAVDFAFNYLNDEYIGEDDNLPTTFAFDDSLDELSETDQKEWSLKTTEEVELLEENEELLTTFSPEEYLKAKVSSNSLSADGTRDIVQPVSDVQLEAIEPPNQQSSEQTAAKLAESLPLEQLFAKANEIGSKYSIESPSQTAIQLAESLSLNQLFSKADEIGNKYSTSSDIEQVEQKLSERGLPQATSIEPPSSALSEDVFLQQVSSINAREKSDIMLAVAERLVNPVMVNEPIARETEVVGYWISTDGTVTTLTDQRQLLLRSDDFQMRISTEPSAIDVQAFQVLDTPTTVPEVIPMSVSQAQLGAITVFNQQVQKIQDDETRQFCENLGTDLEKQATKVQEWEKSFSQGVIQTKAAVAEMKQELVDDLKTGLRNAGNCLLARADAILDQNFAQSAYSLFNRGFDRTGEQAYQQDGFEVKRIEANQFTVSDRQGELMRFSVSKFGRMDVLEKSDRLGRSDYEAFRQFRRDQVVPQAKPVVRSMHQIRSVAVAKTARDFLQQTSVNPWDSEQGNYRIELQAGDKLTVVAKDGRGVILEHSQEGTFSRLEKVDFDRFDETRKMLEVTKSKVALER